MPVGHDFLERLQKARVLQKSITRSVKDLIMDFQSGKIVVPSYQRTFVWDIPKQCRFIESVFMDVPIPSIFLLEKFDEEKDERLFEVIDGVQRLTTLGHFRNGTLKLTNLLTLPDLNQSTYPSLPQKISSLFLERQINTIVIESGTHPEIQFEVFGRLNQGSVSLNSQELRNCMFHGEFNDFLNHCNHSVLYRELLSPFPKFKPVKEGKPDPNRMLDIELILRFFAFYELYKPESNQYPEARGETLNDYMRLRTANADKNHKVLLQQSNLKTNEELESLFDKVLRLVKIAFNDKHFRNFSIKKDKAQFSQPLNQAIFDVQMLGFVDYAITDIQDNAEIIYEAFLDICSYDRNFIDAVSQRTDSKLNERIGIWKNKLSQVLENPQPYYEKLELKKQQFNSNPICSSSGERLETIDEADFVNGLLYHRCFSPSLTQTEQPRKRTTVNSPTKFYLNSSLYELDNILEAIDMIIEFVVDRIKEDEYSINRLASLSFVGTNRELSDKSNRELKKFKPLGLENLNSKKLYIDVSGSRIENMQNLKEIASLFSFMNDFKFIEE